MKNNTNRIYKAPKIEMIILNSQDVISNSWLAFFGEDDRLTKEEDVVLEEVNNIDPYSYNVPCEE